MRTNGILPLIASLLPKRIPTSLSLLLSSGSLSSSFTRSYASMSKFTCANISPENISFIDANLAKTIDERLMSQPGFSIDQLMELAGYSVASAAHDFYVNHNTKTNTTRNVMLFCGPGNNGGDGLVAARHLKHFGYSPSVIYPKASKGQLFTNLVQQCQDLNIPVILSIPDKNDIERSDLVVDALFGFSFTGPPREPFHSLISTFSSLSVPILSVDIPSGWDVNEGDVFQTGFVPQGVVSLTLPKLSLSPYRGVHYVGGRFMPPKLAAEMGLKMPDYGFGPSQIVKLNPPVPDPLAIMYITASSTSEAKAIAQALLAEQLAACVTLSPVSSLYTWEGKLEEGSETLLMVKTRESLTSQVTERVKALHSYQVPESIVVKIEEEGGNKAYMDWVRTNTKHN